MLDPNITACKDSEILFDELISTRAIIDFNQGIDVRLITDKHCDQLNRMRIKRIHMAWDNYEMKTYESLKRVRPLIKKHFTQLVVYVLTNFNTTHEQDIERVYKLRELGYDPYIMIYDKPNAPKVTKDLQRWCNSKWLFRSCDFKDYDWRKT